MIQKYYNYNFFLLFSSTIFASGSSSQLIAFCKHILLFLMKRATNHTNLLIKCVKYSQHTLAGLQSKWLCVSDKFHTYLGHWIYVLFFPRRYVCKKLFIICFAEQTRTTCTLSMHSNLLLISGIVKRLESKWNAKEISNWVLVVLMNFNWNRINVSTMQISTFPFISTAVSFIKSIHISLDGL